MNPDHHNVWVRNIAALTTEHDHDIVPLCPNCGSKQLHVQYVADPDTRRGFCAVWCGKCQEGDVLRDLLVPDAFDFVSTHLPATAIAQSIPPFLRSFHPAAAGDTHA